MRLSHAGSALTAGFCCKRGRTMFLSVPSFFPWTMVGSSRFGQDTWFKKKDIRKLSLGCTEFLYFLLLCNLRMAKWPEQKPYPSNKHAACISSHLFNFLFNIFLPLEGFSIYLFIF